MSLLCDNDSLEFLLFGRSYEDKQIFSFPSDLSLNTGEYPIEITVNPNGRLLYPGYGDNPDSYQGKVEFGMIDGSDFNKLVDIECLEDCQSTNSVLYKGTYDFQAPGDYGIRILYDQKESSKGNHTYTDSKKSISLAGSTSGDNPSATNDEFCTDKWVETCDKYPLLKFNSNKIECWSSSSEKVGEGITMESGKNYNWASTLTLCNAGVFTNLELKS